MPGVEIGITNVHLDLGAGRRGTDMGPSAMHVAGLVPALQRLGHQVVDVRTIGSVTREASSVGDARARFLDVVRDVCRELADHVQATVDAGRLPLVLGGDHSQAMGTISGLVRHHRRRGKDVAVIWVDAHTDMNTPESSPTGNIHGMPCAVVLGRGAPELVCMGDRVPMVDAK